MESRGNKNQGKEFKQKLFKIRVTQFSDLSDAEFSERAGKPKYWYYRLLNGFDNLGYASFKEACESLGLDVQVIVK